MTGFGIAVFVAGLGLGLALIIWYERHHRKSEIHPKPRIQFQKSDEPKRWGDGKK